MRAAAAELRGRETYFLLIDSIVPRPIAWVTSLAPDGSLNLAPFSFFNGVSSRPPILSISIASKAVTDSEGQRSFKMKDTARNILDVGEFVVHLSSMDSLPEVERSAEHHPPGTNVPELLGLSTEPGTWVSVPRLRAAPIAMECRLEKVVEVGRPVTHLVLGEVLGWHVDDRLLDAEGRISFAAWGPLARMGVDGYGSVEPC
ncbi:MAG: flavin reductase family protein [Myxococcota bacterium]|nr:flavin reductase family protein [Myxococcota bacterium]